MNKVRIGTEADFPEEIIGPAFVIAEKGSVKQLCFEHLAKLTLSVQTKQRRENLNLGYSLNVVMAG